MNIQEFVSIGIVGALVSGVMQFIKTKFDTTSYQNKLITAGLSVIVGVIYVWVRDTSFSETILTILGSASTIYALFLNNNSVTPVV